MHRRGFLSAMLAAAAAPAIVSAKSLMPVKMVTTDLGFVIPEVGWENWGINGWSLDAWFPGQVLRLVAGAGDQHVAKVNSRDIQLSASIPHLKVIHVPPPEDLNGFVSVSVVRDQSHKLTTYVNGIEVAEGSVDLDRVHQQLFKQRVR